jgi:hypothetical protein
MQFFWDEVNEAEIAAHDVDKHTLEAIFYSNDFGYSPHPTIPNRWTGEGSVEGHLFRIAFSKTFPEGIRITTGFRISRRRRRT